MTGSDQVLLAILEGICGWFLIFLIFGLPLHDWWMRRCARKKFWYQQELEAEKWQKRIKKLPKEFSRVETIKESKHHGRN